MLRSALLALLAIGCADPVHAQGAASVECPPTSTRILEGRIQDALDESGLANTGMLIERADGRSLWVVNGSPNERYISSSTAKPVVVAAILDQVARRRLTLRSRAVDLLPGYAAVATGRQRDVELWHLLSMTSGVTQPSQCWNTTSWATYVACVEAMPTANPEREPGAAFSYSTAHLDLAGLMAVAAGGYADWRALFDEWRSAEGLFEGATWNAAFVVAPSVQFNITAPEYMAFLRALERCEILTPALCAQMQVDQIPRNPSRNTLTWPLTLPDGSRLLEDWHFGFGLWLECHSFDWDCAHVDMVSTIGVAGQYGLIERENGYRVVVTPSFGPNATARGALFARSIAPLLEEWAALGRQE